MKDSKRRTRRTVAHLDNRGRPDRRTQTIIGDGLNTLSARRAPLSMSFIMSAVNTTTYLMRVWGAAPLGAAASLSCGYSPTAGVTGTLTGSVKAPWLESKLAKIANRGQPSQTLNLSRLPSETGEVFNGCSGLKKAWSPRKQVSTQACQKRELRV